MPNFTADYTSVNSQCARFQVRYSCSKKISPTMKFAGESTSSFQMLHSELVGIQIQSYGRIVRIDVRMQRKVGFIIPKQDNLRDLDPFCRPNDSFHLHHFPVITGARTAIFIDKNEIYREGYFEPMIQTPVFYVLIFKSTTPYDDDSLSEGILDKNLYQGFSKFFYS